MTEFALYRIIGNALPPRHSRADNVKAIDFIFRSEPRFSSCERIWLLNRILDPAEKTAILALIKQAGEEVIDLPFDSEAHYQAFLDVTGLPLDRRLFGDVSRINPARPLELEWAVRHKSQALIGINAARNEALRRGRARADWTLVLDGGVMFSPEGWAAFVAGVKQAADAKFALIDLRRAFDWDAVGSSTKIDGVEEPQIAFHRSSTDLFDERLRYGNRNKVELLKRIGVDGPWTGLKSASWDAVPPLASPHRGAFLRAGFVTRLPAGNEEAGSADTRTRFMNRFLGVAQRSAEVDLRFARARRKPAMEFRTGIPPADRRLPGPGLEERAAAWLSEADRFITEKQRSTWRGDAHEYVSAAPYWSEDGQRFDGVVQDQRSHDDPLSGHFDRASMLRFLRKTYGLALAGRILGRRELFTAPADLLRRWFLNPATRMNPSMRHAQMIPGRTAVNDVGIIEFREYSYLPYAICLLAEEGALTADEVAAMRSWFAMLLHDCERSRIVPSALDRRNNIGTWAASVLSATALFAGEFDKAYQIVRAASVRLGTQLGPLSLQPHETERTRPLHYSLFSLSGWWSLMRIAQEFGVALGQFKGVGGESLQAAISVCADNRHRFADYAANQAEFDRWIELLRALLAEPARLGSIHLVENAYWGLPPVIVTGHDSTRR